MRENGLKFAKTETRLTTVPVMMPVRKVPAQIVESHAKTESRSNHHFENLNAARARALAASSARFRGAALVSRELRRLLQTAATWSTAARNAASLVLEGWLKPLTFLTNWSEAARISSSVVEGEKLNSVLIFLHIVFPLCLEPRPSRALASTRPRAG